MGEHMFESEIFEVPPPSADVLDLSPTERELIDLPRETGFMAIPPDLAGMPPGPVLAATDVSRLSGHDRVTVLEARQRLVSHVQAGLYSDMSRVADFFALEEDDVELADEAVAFEIRGALHLNRRAAALEVELARDLNHRVPAVGRALGGGSIDLRRARVLCDGTAHLSAPDAKAVVDQVIEAASRCTTGQLRARVSRACLQIDPNEAKSRYRSSHDERRLVSELSVDGTVDIHLLGAAPDRAAEAFNRVDAIARSLRRAGESRTIDQLRADVAIDVLSGRADHPKTGRGTVNIHVDLDTLARLTEEPGDLAGYGPGGCRHRTSGRRDPARLRVAVGGHRSRDGDGAGQRDHSETPGEHAADPSRPLSRHEMCIPRLPGTGIAMRLGPHHTVGSRPHH